MPPNPQGAPQDAIRIVLADTTHPGNIGAAARAMKAMGQERLRLVRPANFPCAEATARAAGADDILDRAAVCRSLPEAIGDCSLVFGATARRRRLAWPTLTPREAAAMALRYAGHGDTAAAFVFGGEQSGLDNRDLEYCHRLVCIPTVPDFRSLNVAAAAQLICYELLLARLAGEQTPPPRAAPPPGTAATPASAEEMMRFYEHLERCMRDTGFLSGRRASPMRRLRLLFNRALPNRDELNILRGFLSAVQRPGRPPAPRG